MVVSQPQNVLIGLLLGQIVQFLSIPFVTSERDAPLLLTYTPIPIRLRRFEICLPRNAGQAGEQYVQELYGSAGSSI